MHLMSHDLSLFLEGGWGLRKTTLSLFKDVTLRLGGGGSKARVTMSLFLPFFFWTASLSIIEQNILNVHQAKKKSPGMKMSEY